MKPEIAQVDVEYKTRLQQAFTHNFPRNFDLWMNTSLESIFYPLCIGLAHASPRNPEEIRRIATTFSVRPFEVPYINYNHFPQQAGAVAFIKQYEPSESSELNRLRIQEAYKQAKATLDELLQNTDPFSGDEAQKQRYLRISSKKFGLAKSIEYFDMYREDILPYIPSDPAVRVRFAHAVEASEFASELRSDFPLSERAATCMYTYAEPLVHDPDFQEQGHIPHLFLLPIWLQDKTVVTDLLSAANVMLTSMSQLKDAGRQLAYTAPVMISQETARGKDSNVDTSMLFALTEGLLSSIQAINMAAGQLRKKYDPPISDESLVAAVIQNRVPTQVARFLPAGYLGPTTLESRYIKSLFIMNRDKIEFNPEYKEIGRKIKDDRRKIRPTLIGLSSPDDYAHNAFMQSVSQFSGLMCPLSREHRGEDKAQGDYSTGIDVISQKLLQTFAALREAKKIA